MITYRCATKNLMKQGVSNDVPVTFSFERGIFPSIRVPGPAIDINSPTYMI